ncbi:origin recognition complex subunit 4 [Condylostylus longicornis]|uniref:origin recognition complex subunit 4 n=1 Tax=Condylostylus longicornis TaxID=2530218 RepID=UPI00244E2063|nr:origin recognition complex subunit 4 [Condylostylus longicornis]
MEDTAKDINLIRKFIKERLQKNCINFHGPSEKLENVRNILHRTAEGESNSIIIIGPRGSGKTTLVNAALYSLLQNEQFRNNTIIIFLNGLIETDDRLALKSITTQMNLENLIDGRVFGSFAENLSYLLSCLKNSNSKESKSVIFILEEFDLFCHHHGQTLLYNLFDISQSAQTPICVLGITCRLDVIELLEKRVKSRYSHRQIYLFNQERELPEVIKLFKEYLSIPDEEYFKVCELNTKFDKIQCLNNNFLKMQFEAKKFNFNPKCVKAWNKNIDLFLNNTSVKQCIAGLIENDLSEDLLKKISFRLISMININHPFIQPEDLQSIYEEYNQDDKVMILIGLSVLEISLLISIKHHCEIYDHDPFNFEIIFSRFTKFALKSTVMQSVERTVALKAFEHLKNLELILPVNTSAMKVKKEFQMHKLALTIKQINQSIDIYTALPTEVFQWSKSCFI